MAEEIIKGQTAGAAENPQEIAKEVMDAAMANVKNAAAGAVPPTNESGMLKDSAADSFKGVPMRELIGGPLFAAAEAQEELAAIALDYYKKIAYEDDGTTTRLLKFDLERPIVQGGVVSSDKNKVTVKAPFLGLVPVPSLLIDRVDVDFQMEVTETNSTTDRSSTELSTDISSKWFGVNVGISGKVSSSRENTRSTNQTAKFRYTSAPVSNHRLKDFRN